MNDVLSAIFPTGTSALNPLVVPTMFDLSLKWRLMGLIESWGLRGIYPLKCSFCIPHSARDDTNLLFFIALLKFIFWHSLGTGVLSRQKSSCACHLFVHRMSSGFTGTGSIFALIMLGHSMGFYGFTWLCTCSSDNIPNAG